MRLKNMANDEFMNDAVEGLEQVNNPAEIQDIVNRLNSKLREQVRSDKQSAIKENQVSNHGFISASCSLFYWPSSVTSSSEKYKAPDHMIQKATSKGGFTRSFFIQYMLLPDESGSLDFTIFHHRTYLIYSP